MLRVTKPGGRVMVSDPDHGQAGLALDDPAHRRVYEALQRAMMRMIVNPHSGTRLRGMFVRAGLGDVAQLVNSFAFDHPQFMQMFFVRERLAAATAAGEITESEGAEFIAALEERHRAGTFFGSAVGYTVAGTKRECPRRIESNMKGSPSALTPPPAWTSNNSCAATSAAWEQRDEKLLCDLFAPDGTYHNTPFAVQRGHAEIAQYWQRVKLQEDIEVSLRGRCAIARGRRGALARDLSGGVGGAVRDLGRVHRNRRAGAQSGDPLPRLALDGMLVAEFNAGGLCQTCRLWWHSVVQQRAT